MKFFTTLCFACCGALGLILGVPTAAHASSLDATGAIFEFGVAGQTVNDAADLDVGIAPGASIHYVGVTTIDTTVVDAVVTFVSGVNSEDVIDGAPDVPDYLDRLDDNFPDDSTDAYLEPILDPNNGSLEARATIRVDFFETGTYTGPGTGTPATLRNLALNLYDLDELQFFLVEGIRGYSLSTNTHVTADETSADNFTFTAGAGATNNTSGTAQTVGRVKVVFASADSVTFILGTPPDLGRGLFDLQFGDGVAWTDDNGGTEDTSTLPEPEPAPEPEYELPTTGFGMAPMVALAAGVLAVGTAVWTRGRIRA